jgi:HAD superfamily hydrolase (TIGR01509 family)
MSYDLIIFDCDGTLVNSHDMNHSIMAQVANEYSDLTHTMKSVETEYLGVDYNKFFKIVADKEGIQIPDSASQRCVDLALENISSLMRSIDGVGETLAKLAPRYPLTVCSNANKQIVIESLTALDLLDYFDADKIVAGRAMATPKPAPDLFLMAADKMEVSPDKCLVIEDSTTGVKAAVAAGMEVWGFTGVAQHPESATKSLKQAGATQIFDRFIHIADALSH